MLNDTCCILDGDSLYYGKHFDRAYCKLSNVSYKDGVEIMNLKLFCA